MTSYSSSVGGAHSLRTSVIDMFAQLFGQLPTFVVRAPGRVNLIGDHTDYNDGFVLPLAIDRDCMVAWRRRDDDRVRVQSLDRGEQADVAADGTDEVDGLDPEWAGFVVGVLRALREQGGAPNGADIALSSTVPPGSGLSSSAALSVALSFAITGASGEHVDGRELARVAQDRK